jgi:hypothetical protein
MPKLTVNGATLKCTMGSAPSQLTVLPAIRSDVEEQSSGTIQDHIPMVNVMPFGMCQSTSNPQVAAATAAAQGVLTPQPCIPVLPSDWTPGASIVTVQGIKALSDNSTCSCQWAGTISITDPGDKVVDVE